MLNQKTKTIAVAIAFLVVCSTASLHAQKADTQTQQDKTKPAAKENQAADFETTLKKHVEQLATTIGERNLLHYKELCACLLYTSDAADE